MSNAKKAKTPSISANERIKTSISERNSFLTFSNFKSSSVKRLLALEYRLFEYCQVINEDTTVETTATAIVSSASDSIVTTCNLSLSVDSRHGLTYLVNRFKLSYPYLPHHQLVQHCH